MEIAVFGTRIRVEFSFLVFIQMLFLMKNGREIFAFFTVCLLHEIGHGVALLLCGGRVSRIILTGIGVRMLPERKLLSVKREAVILFAGPLVNLMLFILFRSSVFGMLNLCAAFFNLLPYRLLDGGAILELILPEHRRIRLIIGMIPTIAAATAVVFYGIEYLPLLCITIFYFAADCLDIGF